MRTATCPPRRTGARNCVPRNSRSRASRRSRASWIFLRAMGTPTFRTSFGRGAEVVAAGVAEAGLFSITKGVNASKSPGGGQGSGNYRHDPVPHAYVQTSVVPSVDVNATVIPFVHFTIQTG